MNLVHYIGAMEGYYDSLDRLEEDLHGYQLPSGGRIRVRKLQFYDFVVEERSKTEFLETMKSLGFIAGRREKIVDCDDEYDGAKIWKKFDTIILPLIHLIGKFFKIKPVTLKNIKSNGWWDRQRQKGRHYLFHGYLFGEIADGRFENGQEII